MSKPTIKKRTRTKKASGADEASKRPIEHPSEGEKDAGFQKGYRTIESTARRVFDQAKDTAISLAQDAAELVRGRPWQPAIDLFTQGSEVVLRADLPGADADAIDIAAVPNMVTIHGAVPIDPPDDAEDVVFHERRRRVGEFRREVPLPAAVDSDKVRAQMRKGVLEIRMTIVPETKLKPKSVKVSSEGQ